MRMNVEEGRGSPEDMAPFVHDEAVPYAAAGRRRQESVQGHDPFEDLLPMTGLAIAAEFADDLVEVLPLNRSLDCVGASEGRSNRLK